MKLEQVMKNIWKLCSGPRMGAHQVHQQEQGLARYQSLYIQIPEVFYRSNFECRRML